MDYSTYDLDFSDEGRRRVHAFSYVLGYSRRQYLHFVEAQDFATTVREHIRAFEHLGGVAATCLYDNMKVVVSGYDGDEPVYNPRFLAFAAHYGGLGGLADAPARRPPRGRHGREQRHRRPSPRRSPAPAPPSLVTYRASHERAHAVADGIAARGGRALVAQADLGTRAACEALVAEARERLGGLDVWVNNAGADVLTGEAADWDWERKLDLLLAVDLKGTIACSYAAGAVDARAAGGGAIVNMSWDHVTSGMAGENPELFSAVKGGVLAYSKSLARALAPGGARQRPVPGLDRDRVRRAGRPRVPPLGGASRRRCGRWGTPDGRRRGGALPRLAGGGVHHRAGDQRQRRRCDVVQPSKEAIAMATQEKLKPYTDEEVEAKIAEHGLDGWYLEDGWLRRKYNTDGWPTTLMLVNAVGYLCEAAYHHADLSVTWGKLWVKLTTHSAGGITDKDFALARKIEDAVLWRPAPTARSRARRTSSSSARARASARGAWPSGCLFVTGKLAAPALRGHAGPRRAAVRLRRRGHEDHGRRADDHRLDRQAPRGPGRRSRGS